MLLESTYVVVNMQFVFYLSSVDLQIGHIFILSPKQTQTKVGYGTWHVTSPFSYLKCTDSISNCLGCKQGLFVL